MFILILRDIFVVLLPPATKLGQGNIFRSVCQEFCPREGACMAGGGMCGREGMHGRGECVVGWCIRGRWVCVAGGACVAVGACMAYGQ